MMVKRIFGVVLNFRSYIYDINEYSIVDLLIGNHNCLQYNDLLW